MNEWLVVLSPHLVSGLLLAATLIAAAHAVLNKREVRAALGWVGLIVLLPGVGALLYALLGINRIRRRAARVRGGIARYHDPHPTAQATPEDVLRRFGEEGRSLAELAHLIDRTTQRPLLTGNRIWALQCGDIAYPAMLEAIEAASHTIVLATYLFDNDPIGRRFVEALSRARRRGVEVRVLMDDAGARYSRPALDAWLRREGVLVARFLPMWIPWRLAFNNLRNHRKILVIDGRLGFTGGMNIRHGSMLSEDPAYPTDDLHFRLEGPVVRHLTEVFAEDWAFTTGEAFGNAWFPQLPAAGPALARGIADGPDEDLGRMRWALLGAAACAQKSLQIVTPYFLPDEGLVTALNLAALRGVTIDVLLPEQGNLQVVQWAMWGEIWKVLSHGCRVWLTGAPFDHSKLLVVDECWTLIGSSNWDPRSLRLNFEFGVECYDADFGAQMSEVVRRKLERARPLELSEVQNESWLRRLRNATARLLTPYL